MSLSNNKILYSNNCLRFLKFNWKFKMILMQPNLVQRSRWSDVAAFS